MPHIYTYPQAVIDAIRLQGTPEQKVRVYFTGRMKYVTATAANGATTLSPDYRWTTLEITERIDAGSPLSFFTQKPSRPSGSGKDMRGSNVRVVAINTDERFGVSQDGSIIDADTITACEINIQVEIGGVEIQLYKGRVIGFPEERAGKTIFTIRDAVADIVDKPLRWENISPLQEMRINEENVPEITYYESGSSPYSLSFFDAYTAFDQTGYPYSTLRAGKATLKNIDFTGSTLETSGLDLGVFTIKFLSSVGYVVTGPNFPTTYGNVNDDLVTGAITILADDWVIEGDPEGSEITFNTCYTVSGNPITLAKRLLEHGILGTWGNEPKEYDWLPIDWDKFNLLEKRHAGSPVFVSETNSTNEGFKPGAATKPVSVKNVVEWIMEHLGLSIITDDQGRISSTELYRTEADFLHPVTDDMIYEHYFPGGERKINIIKLQYGSSGQDQSYSAETVVTKLNIEVYDPAESYDIGNVVSLNAVYWICIVPNVAGAFIFNNWRIYDPQQHELKLKYFPKATGKYQVNKTVASHYLERIFSSHEKITCKVLSPIGVTFIAGDMVQFQISEQPAKTFYAELVSVTKIPGGDVSITAQRIQNLPRTYTGYDTGNWNEGVYEG